jgi:hypothetical protein
MSPFVSGTHDALLNAVCAPEKSNFKKARRHPTHHDDPRNQTDLVKLASLELTISTGSSSISISPEIVQILHLGDNSECFVVDRLDVLWWQNLQNGHCWATC